MRFELLDAFKDKDFIADLKLCRVLLEDKEYPWVLLLPMRPGLLQMNDLSEEDSIQLIKEINFMSEVMESLFKTDRLNVAAIGNKTPQLHIHIISRTEGDQLWPETIWGKKMDKITAEERKVRVNAIRKKIEELWI